MTDAPVLYDIALDAHRPATQDDVNALHTAAARYVKLRDGLTALIASGEFVAIHQLRALLASVEPKPAD